MVTFSDSELSDIRIALQDRVAIVAARGSYDDADRVEIERLNALIAKVSI